MKTSVLLVLAALLGTLASGCMQTTMPIAGGTHTLTATAVLKQAGDAASPGVPLPGVEVNMFDTDPAAANAPQRGVTDANGIVRFTFVVPAAGKAFDVTAKYVNAIQRIPSILLCADTVVHFVFDTTTPALIDCAALNARDTLIFINERGDTALEQGMPLGTEKYERCWSVTNPASASGPVSIALASPGSPFSMTSAYVDGTPVAASGTVSLAPGSSLSLCFAVSTRDTGILMQTIMLAVQCPSSKGTIALTLRAHVVTPPCLCSAEDILLPHSTRIAVGDSTEFTDQVYVNHLSCPVVIDLIAFNGQDGLHAWTLLSPAFPVTVQPGGQLAITTRFAPRAAGATEDTLVLRITPRGGQPCTVTAVLQASGCTGMCPQIVRNGTAVPFGQAMYVDTLWNPIDPTSNRLQVSVLSVSPPIITGVDTVYEITLDNTACAPVTVTLDMALTDTTSARFFTLSPSSITLQPGQTRSVTVHFTSPDITDFRAIVARRQSVGAPHPVTADSAFTCVLRMLAPGCTQVVRVVAVLTPYPPISPIINLRAYSQRTPFKPSPEDEVYTFGDAARVSLRTVEGDGPYPPDKGDIYINVTDTTVSGVPPLPPMLYLRNTRFVGMKKWKTGYLESDFDNVPATVIQFFATPGYNIGYTAGPLSPIATRDVIAFQYNSGGMDTYALMYVRAVLDGTENNSNKQSAIEFRAIYPVVRP